MQNGSGCPFFGSAKGCRNKCNLSHDRPNDTPECRDYKRGSCKYDKSCKYRHEIFKLVEKKWVSVGSIASFPLEGGNKQRKQTHNSKMRQSRRNHNKKKAAAKQTILLQSVPIKSKIKNHSNSKPLSYAERARLSSVKKIIPTSTPQQPPQQEPIPILEEEPDVEQPVENSPREEPILEPETIPETEKKFIALEERGRGEDDNLPTEIAAEEVTEMISSIELPSELPSITENKIEQKKPTSQPPPGLPHPLDRNPAPPVAEPVTVQHFEQNNFKFQQQAQPHTISQGRVQHFESHMHIQPPPPQQQQQQQLHHAHIHPPPPSHFHPNHQPNHQPPQQQRRPRPPPVQRFQQQPHPNQVQQNQPPNVYHNQFPTQHTYYHPIQYAPNPQFHSPHHHQFQHVPVMMNTHFVPALPVVHNPAHGQIIQNPTSYMLPQYPNNFQHPPPEHSVVYPLHAPQQFPPHGYENANN